MCIVVRGRIQIDVAMRKILSFRSQNSHARATLFLSFGVCVCLIHEKWPAISMFSWSWSLDAIPMTNIMESALLFFSHHKYLCPTAKC